MWGKQKMLLRSHRQIVRVVAHSELDDRVEHPALAKQELGGHDFGRPQIVHVDVRGPLRTRRVRVMKVDLRITGGRAKHYGGRHHVQHQRTNDKHRALQRAYTA